ncbi:MAG TPA: glycosyltransferase [Pirellulales bacterium]|nr:glycosyltransferase [Pirellulales bacterium]
MTDLHAPRRTALIVNSLSRRTDTTALGETGYSYDFVLRAFLPLLELYGDVTRVDRPESQVDFAVRRLSRRGLDPVQLSFRPFSDVYLSRSAANVVFPFWEFPDIPSTDYKDNPRNNWLRIANHASLILTASQFTADALARAGVKKPVRVVPVPISPPYFDVPDWQRGQTVAIDCRSYVLYQPEVLRLRPADPEARPGPDSTGFRLKNQLRSLARRIWVDGLKPLLPLRLSKALVAAKNAGKRAWKEGETELPIPASRLELSGIVYTAILNPDDKRKNWQDLITAFLLALGDRDDATLVLKLVVSYAAPVREVLAFYNKLGVPHRAKIVLVTDYLSDAQMRELARASTFYVNASRAEGACLPLEDHLAAGRPGIAPASTAMSDYFDSWVGFVVEAHPEPCPWPDDESGRLHTSWQRIVWSSLCDQFAASYDVAKTRPEVYQQLSSQARARMKSWASVEAVWPKLRDALDLVLPVRESQPVLREAA